ncbi:alpha-amylase [Flavobacteriaceae bacterium Ap0902]|nr:alpha-amylase [Flavobacteriaceae bacterium Ap0902]
MNGTIIQYFHWYTPGDGELWDEVIKQAQWISSLGITDVWLPPAYKGAGGGFSNGYDPYDLFDLGEFDQKGTVPTKYGTKEKYLEAIKTLKDNDIRLIVDVVLNHKAGGDEKEKFQVVQVDEDNRNKDISDVIEIESYTKFTFPGRQGQYSDFIWDFNCFTGVDYAEGRGPGIYRVITDYGDGWNEVISHEKGNFDYLMNNDIEFRNPNVINELNYWGQWYHEQTGFSGVRLDAVKHITPSFYKNWLYTLRENTGENIFAVGEYWAPGRLDLLTAYIDATDGSMSLFDSSLQQNFVNASNMGDQFDLRKIFDETLVQAMPDKAVTVVGNHDTQPLQELEAPVEKWFQPIAYALILLREEGYPCVFYPHLYGVSYWDEGDNGERYEIFLDKTPHIEDLIKARAHNAYGLQRDYFEDANCLGWTREGDDNNSGCAVLLSNKDGYTKPMEMGHGYAGKVFIDVTGNRQEEVTVNDDGWGDFHCPAGGVSVWVLKEN